jgi:hypothetical protein
MPAASNSLLSFSLSWFHLTHVICENRCLRKQQTQKTETRVVCCADAVSGLKALCSGSDPQKDQATVSKDRL